MRRTLVLPALLLLLAATPAFAGWEEGVDAFNSGRYGAAEAEFRAFVEQSPDTAEGHYMLGLTFQRQKRNSGSFFGYNHCQHNIGILLLKPGPMETLSKANQTPSRARPPCP